jgi:dihydroneopterin aldolase
VLLDRHARASCRLGAAHRLAGKLRLGRPVHDGLSGWISIRGLRCRARQGTTPEERERESDYLVDVSVQADLRHAVESDDLAAAIDIAAIADTVRAELARRPRTLVERMAADVAASLLERFTEAQEVRARVEKQDPEGLGAAAESVEITRRRGTPHA